MILPLAEHLLQSDAPSTIAGCLMQHAQELGQLNMEAAGGGEHSPARSKYAHSPQIDFAVPAERRRYRGARLGERRRIENDKVEALSRSLQLPQALECIGFDPLDI
jgi:hypothetical protein